MSQIPCATLENDMWYTQKILSVLYFVSCNAHSLRFFILSCCIFFTRYQLAYILNVKSSALAKTRPHYIQHVTQEYFLLFSMREGIGRGLAQHYKKTEFVIIVSCSTFQECFIYFVAYFWCSCRGWAPLNITRIDSDNEEPWRIILKGRMEKHAAINICTNSKGKHTGINICTIAFHFVSRRLWNSC